MNIDLNMKFEIEGLSPDEMNIKGVIVGATIDDDGVDSPEVTDFILDQLKVWDDESEKWMIIPNVLNDHIEDLIEGTKHERTLHEKIREAYYKQLREE